MKIKLVIILVLLLLILLIKNREGFTAKVFGILPVIKPCRPEDDCYPGSYARTQKYHNMCQPLLGLNRQKIQLQNNCQQNLGKMSQELYKTQDTMINQDSSKYLLQPVMSPDKNKLVCVVDNHLQRRCFWVK